MTIGYGSSTPARRQRRACIFTFITALARISAFITLIALVSTVVLQWVPESKNYFRIYITTVTLIFAYLELLWIFDKFVTCCICLFRTETCFDIFCCVPIDNWIKTILYTGLAIPLFVPIWSLRVNEFHIYLSGFLLLLTGLLYLIKTFKYKQADVNDEHGKDEDDAIFDPSLKSYTRPSISTQTSTMGINNDKLSSSITLDQEVTKKH